MNKKEGNTESIYSKGLGMFTYESSSCHGQGEQGPDAGFLLVHGCRCLGMGTKHSSKAGFATLGKEGHTRRTKCRSGPRTSAGVLCRDLCEGLSKLYKEKTYQDPIQLASACITH